mmetsp:Transcript_4745/g.6520  ORF Transcript_4745/g.6520 Transcript_4745/m.6520 type:complete len:118 (-) Transcript_4745:239-592(-)
MMKNSSMIKKISLPTSQPSSVFVAPTGPADETSPPILSVKKQPPIKNFENNHTAHITKAKNKPYNFTTNSPQRLNPDMKMDSITAVNSATYMFYTFVVVFLLIATCNFFRKFCARIY